MARRTIFTLSAVIIAAAAIFFIWRSQSGKVKTVTGVVLVQNSDPRKQAPIERARIDAAVDGLSSQTQSDASGFFKLTFKKGVERGRAVIIAVRHAGYEPAQLTGRIGGQIFVAWLSPVPVKSVSARPEIPITNVRVRYSARMTAALDIAPFVKTFEIINKGNVPCGESASCSPDGKWMAARSTETVDAGDGNEFRNVRLSCIAGPCPFTRIESQNFLVQGQKLEISVLNWSGTTTFLLEAEVSQRVASNIIRLAYPAIFGQTLSFTLPVDSEGPSIEADLKGRDIVFPLGPDLIVDWAVCTETSNAQQGKLIRCSPKPGYAFK
jgi:hypothetical protein